MPSDGPLPRRFAPRSPTVTAAAPAHPMASVAVPAPLQRPRGVPGLPMFAGTMADLVDLVAGWAAEDRFRVAIGVNANVVNLMADSRGFAARVLDADLRYADGQSLVWASRLFGLPVPERVATTDLAEPLAARLAVEGRRMFFLGGADGVAEAAAERLRERIPGLLVRTSHGFRGAAATPEILREIAEFGTDVLLIGMGDPAQLDFVTANRDALGPIAVLTCGGLFDWLSGRMHRAPGWMISAGLEWLWRLCIEPRRLFRRYVVGNPRFVLRVAALRLRFGRAARPASAPEPFAMPEPSPRTRARSAGDALLDARRGEHVRRDDAAPRIRLVPTTDGAVWDALVAGADGGTMFHTWAWLDLQARLQQAPIERLLVLDGDRPIGVFPMPRRPRPAIDSLPASFPYLGPLVAADRLAATLQAFRRRQLRHGMVLGRFEFGPAASPATAAALGASGLPVWEDATIVVDLRHGSAEAMRAAYTASRRKELRRAARDGCTVRPALPGEVAALLPRVLAEAFEARGGASPYPDEIGTVVEDWARGRTDVGVFTVLVGDEPAGCQVVVGAGTSAMAWVGASLRRFRDQNAGVLLYDALLEWALEHGYAEVDLCGVVDEGVRRHKLAFGGTERPYLRSESFLGPKRLRPASGRVAATSAD